MKIMEFDWLRCCSKDAFGKDLKAVNPLGVPGWTQVSVRRGSLQEPIQEPLISPWKVPPAPRLLQQTQV